MQWLSANWLAILNIVAPAGAAFVGAWLAARFGLSRFYREKVWERKAATYTAIFDALHDMNNWFTTHLDALEQGVELASNRKSELYQSYANANAKLRRRIDVEAWLIPSEYFIKLEKLLTDLKFPPEANWFEIIDTGSMVMSENIKLLRVLFRNDLHVK
jgi:hypothetical protein